MNCGPIAFLIFDANLLSNRSSQAEMPGWDLKLPNGIVFFPHGHV